MINGENGTNHFPYMTNRTKTLGRIDLKTFKLKKETKTIVHAQHQSPFFCFSPPLSRSLVCTELPKRGKIEGNILKLCLYRY